VIAWLRGRVIDRRPTQVVLDVNGVGYAVAVTVQNPVRASEDVQLYIHTHVREDTLQLFGFADPTERHLFDLLLTVPNIGPVKAMQILQTPVADFVAIVAQRDAARLSKLPGVGKKTAERILVDLADKTAGLGPSPPSVAPATGRTDLVSALIHLGFKESVADEAARWTLTAQPEASLEEQLRTALARLSDGRGTSVE
jgi:Holliday junction DNA helicase RuvA